MERYIRVGDYWVRVAQPELARRYDGWSLAGSFGAGFIAAIMAMAAML
jgi:hypothetical protein